VQPEGNLRIQDFEALSQAVDPFIEKKGELSGLIIVTRKFPGWAYFNGMLEHIKFVKSHHRKIAKVALVTDSKIADVAESLGKHFVKPSIKHFPFNDFESAKSWLSQ
jgi:hypothetical protein